MSGTASLTMCAVLGAGIVLTWAAAKQLAGPPRAGNRLPDPGRLWPVGVGFAVIAGVTVAAADEPRFVPVVLLVFFGVPAAYTDARELRLPDPLTYGLAAATAAAVVVLALTGVPGSVLWAVVGGIGYPLVLLAIALLTPTRATPAAATAGSGGDATTVPATRPTALGLGDVKLAVGVGIVAGWGSPAALTTALLLTAAGHLLWVIGCSIGRHAGARSGLSGTAMGPWMVAGGLAAVVLTA
ncbi:hypothetical protein GCM10027047_16800 [Rhodococcus aerolatus]